MTRPEKLGLVWGYTALIWVVIIGVTLLTRDVSLLLPLEVLCLMVGIAGTFLVVATEKPLDTPGGDD